jgi:hypothetical protein
LEKKRAELALTCGWTSAGQRGFWGPTTAVIHHHCFKRCHLYCHGQKVCMCVCAHRNTHLFSSRIQTTRDFSGLILGRLKSMQLEIHSVLVTFLTPFLLAVVGFIDSGSGVVYLL